MRFFEQVKTSTVTETHRNPFITDQPKVMTRRVLYRDSAPFTKPKSVVDVSLICWTKSVKSIRKYASALPHRTPKTFPPKSWNWSETVRIFASPSICLLSQATIGSFRWCAATTPERLTSTWWTIFSLFAVPRCRWARTLSADFVAKRKKIFTTRWT